MFQAFDVPLMNGANVLTFHATDMAGNVTTTNFSYTLDYSGKTNLPAIQVYWPQNGDQVSGTEFTLRGSLDDFTASLTAQIVNSSGGTNTVQGLVERNGLYWVENVPLLAGTNYVTLTAMDAAGNISTTNLMISLSAGLTIDDFASELGGDPRNVVPVVTGTVALTNYTLWVNGVQATQDGQGNWEADSVPVGPGGTAVVETRAIPNSDNNGNGTGTAPSTDGTPSNPTADDSIAAQTQFNQPTMIYLQSYDYQANGTTIDYYNCVTNCPATWTHIVDSQFCWDVMAGGTDTEYVEDDLDGCDGPFPTEWEKDVYTYFIDFWPPTLPGESVYTDSLGDYGTSSAPAPSVPMVEWSETDHPFWNFAPEQCPASAQGDANIQTTTTVTLQTGGKGVIGYQNVIEIYISATAYLTYSYDSDFNQIWTTQAVPGDQITINGQTANANGQIFVVLPDNSTMDETPQTPFQRYTYSEDATKYNSYFYVFVEQPDPTGTRVWTPSDSAGHAWWMLGNAAPPNPLIPSSLTSFMNIPVGYAPTNGASVTLLFPTAPGMLRDPEPDYYYSVYRKYQIGFPGLLNGLKATQTLYTNPGTYGIYTFNCVDAVIKTAGAAGKVLPDDKGPKSYSNPEYFGKGLPQ
jgi:hypothetical protein